MIGFKKSPRFPNAARALRDNLPTSWIEESSDVLLPNILEIFTA